MKPEFNVTLDGTRLDGEAKGAVSGVRVFLTHSGASAFEIVVDDPELRWQAKPTFTECKEVQIELGVPGKMKKVFDGEVTAWRTELERAGPTVLVLRGMDRSHRLMRGHKTKTYAEASPIDCAQQIASAAGLTAKTSAGQPAPVKTFRIQANESDFGFLRKMADLEGYLFFVDGSDLHFERPKLSSKDDLTITFGEDVKTFLPVANFRRPAAKVEVGGWDSAGKAALTGKAKPGDEMWSVPGGKPGAEVATFQGTKASIGIVESQVATQEHADTVAKAALTRRSLEFLTAEVEVQGNPEIKPGAMVNVKKVGVYSGHYVVTEASHFFDAAGYSCIFYVARDKWGDSSTDEEKKKRDEEQKKQAKGGAEKPYKPPKAPPKKPPPDESIDFTLEGDDGKPLANVKCKIKLKSGEVIEATTDGDGHVQVDEKPHGPYTVQITGDALALTSIDVVADDADAESGGTSGGAGAAEEKEAAAGGGGSHQEAGAAGGGTSEEDDAKGAKESSASGGAAAHREGDYRKAACRERTESWRRGREGRVAGAACCTWRCGGDGSIRPRRAWRVLGRACHRHDPKTSRGEYAPRVSRRVALGRNRSRRWRDGNWRRSRTWRRNAKRRRNRRAEDWNRHGSTRLARSDVYGSAGRRRAGGRTRRSGCGNAARRNAEREPGCSIGCKHGPGPCATHGRRPAASVTDGRCSAAHAARANHGRCPAGRATDGRCWPAARRADGRRCFAERADHGRCSSACARQRRCACASRRVVARRDRRHRFRSRRARRGLDGDRERRRRRGVDQGRGPVGRGEVGQQRERRGVTAVRPPAPRWA